MTVECDDGNAGVSRDATQYRVGADESVSLAVVRAVASASGRSPAGGDGDTDTLDPLARSVDPEALDSIFGSRGDAPADVAAAEFQYCGRQVTVEGGESVHITVE